MRQVQDEPAMHAAKPLYRCRLTAGSAKIQQHAKCDALRPRVLVAKITAALLRMGSDLSCSLMRQLLRLN